MTKIKNTRTWLQVSRLQYCLLRRSVSHIVLGCKQSKWRCEQNNVSETAEKGKLLDFTKLPCLPPQPCPILVSVDMSSHPLATPTYPTCLGRQRIHSSRACYWRHRSCPTCSIETPLTKLPPYLELLQWHSLQPPWSHLQPPWPPLHSIASVASPSSNDDANNAEPDWAWINSVRGSPFVGV